MSLPPEEIDRILKMTLLHQSRSLLELLTSVDKYAFKEAIRLLKEGCFIFTLGIGKSAYVAGKIADTFSSVGSPSLFLRAEQVLHGSVGVLREKSCLLLISKSGETQELIDSLSSVQYTKLSKILITSQKGSSLAQLSDVVLLYECEECDAANFVPTTSTTLSLVMGDALAMVLMHENGLTVEQFSRFHPGGSLGELVRDSVGSIFFPSEKKR